MLLLPPPQASRPTSPDDDAFLELLALNGRALTLQI